MKLGTIAAIATAIGNGGISIIRVSGDHAVAIVDKIYKSKLENKKLSTFFSHTMHYGFIVDEEQVIDEVMVVMMKAPNSYTREDIVEIHCHGGAFVTKKILETVMKYGADPADPGEFTKRAFLNGRIDLSQAEAVNHIIRAKNDYALKNSIHQLRGDLKNKIKEIRKNILGDVAFIEAALDDPEHMTLDGFEEKLLEHLNKNIYDLELLLKNADNGRILTEGIRTVILGKPNVGKSSLLNILLGEERAIVTEVAGTTRDILEETILIDGIMLNIMDTAGIRHTDDRVEKIGVEKAKKYALDADLILYVIDKTTKIDENDLDIDKMIGNKRAIILLNKTDINPDNYNNKVEVMFHNPVISISAKTNIGIDELKNCIKKMFYEGKVNFNDEIYITNIRHKKLIMEAIQSLKQVEESMIGKMPEDFYTIDLMSGYEELGKIIGESVEDDLVNTIFSEFCVGK